MTKTTTQFPGDEAAMRPVSRRTILKGTAAGAIAAAGPWYIKGGLASSGELNWFTWEDYAPKPLVEKFVKDTGIKLNVTLFSSNEELLNKLRASRGEGFDMVTPSTTWIGAHLDAGTLAPLERNRLTNIKNMANRFARLPEEHNAIRDGKPYCVPYLWLTEALSFNTKVVDLKYGTASYGDLWDARYKGKMMCRERSIIIGTGLWMEGKGQLPPGSMTKAYADESAMVKSYGYVTEFIIKSKSQIGKFWKGAADTQAGFLQDGMVIAQTWDGPINTLRNEGNPFMYLSPKEGALASCDSLALAKGARNVEQAYAFMNWILQPEIGGLMANTTGYNSVVRGAEKYANANFSRNFADAYPGDAIDNLWFHGESRSWFLAKRQEFVDKIRAA